jgi:hypothetical protein
MLKRRRAYLGIDWQHLVVLADQLTDSEAERLERSLQHKLQGDKGHVCYARYSAERRDGRYFNSRGGKSYDPTDQVHSVYMAWWEK